MLLYRYTTQKITYRTLYLEDDSEAQNIITGVMKLFRYIYSTDAFFKTYQKLLCMRVLSDNLKNKDMEIDLIS